MCVRNEDKSSDHNVYAMRGDSGKLNSVIANTRKESYSSTSIHINCTHLFHIFLNQLFKPIMAGS